MREDRGKRGDAAELPADPSSVSVEANDAKTGVHCPQLRAWGERENKGKRGGERTRGTGRQGESSREEQRVFLCSIGRAAHTTTSPSAMRPTKKTGRVVRKGCAVDLIFKCKQIYIPAKAPPSTLFRHRPMPTAMEGWRFSYRSVISDRIFFFNHREPPRRDPRCFLSLCPACIAVLFAEETHRGRLLPR